MEILSQRDPRWSGIQLGTGPYTIGQDGCAITSIAMLAGTTPDVVNALGDYVNDDEIVWSKVASDLGLPFGSPQRPCVAQTFIDGQYMHFFVLNADGTILDPWTGTQQSEGYYNIVNIINIGTKQGGMMLADKTIYIIGPSGRNLGYFSTGDEVRACVGDSQSRLTLYDNNFITYNNALYQHVASPSALSFIDPNNQRNVTPITSSTPTDDQKKQIIKDYLNGLLKNI